MRQAHVPNLQFPPTQGNARDYFDGLRNDPQVGRRFEQYVTAFFHHHGREGTIEYDADRHPGVPTNTPEDWSDVTDSRQLRGDGRRAIDCEGYAYLGEQWLRAAGFRNMRYEAATLPPILILPYTATDG